MYVRARAVCTCFAGALVWGRWDCYTTYTQNLQKIGTKCVLDKDDSLIDDLHHHLMLLLRICEVDTPLDPIAL